MVNDWSPSSASPHGIPGGLPRHLVTVWNPLYAVDALDLHTQLLLDLARDPGVPEEDVYVWWGKVRSVNRQQPLEHKDEVLALGAELAGRDEMQLYLTDYRSLYVADIGAISPDAMYARDRLHIPKYYAEKGLACDFWFQLRDIRALVLDDTLGVQHELQQLRVVKYNDRPVSLYGGMRDLPLIVTRPDGARFFTDGEREQFNDNRRWVEADAERHGMGGLMSELRDNVFGERTWLALEPQARTFIATGERLMRDHRRDPSFDFSAVLVELAKAVEVQVNTTLSAAMKGAPAGVANVHTEHGVVDLSRRGALSLGQLGRVISGDRERFDWLAKHLEHGTWFTQQLPPILDELAQYRNRAAHMGRLTRDVAVPLRERIVGVGCAGLMTELSRVKAKRR